MICTLSDREKELMDIIKPYFVYEGSGYIKEDAPEEAKKALEELRKIADEREDISKL